MTIRLGELAPDFEQDTANGSIRFHCWLGVSWGLLFSYPADAGSVSTDELVGVASLKPELDRRNTKPIALSVQGTDASHRFGSEIAARQGRSLNFPLIADCDRKVARLYRLLDEEACDLVSNSVVLIDPARRVRLTMTYPPNVGRNFKEVLRVIDGLQATDIETASGEPLHFGGNR